MNYKLTMWDDLIPHQIRLYFGDGFDMTIVVSCSCLISGDAPLLEAPLVSAQDAKDAWRRHIDAAGSGKAP